MQSSYSLIIYWCKVESYLFYSQTFVTRLNWIILYVWCDFVRLSLLVADLAPGQGWLYSFLCQRYLTSQLGWIRYHFSLLFQFLRYSPKSCDLSNRCFTHVCGASNRNLIVILPLKTRILFRSVWMPQLPHLTVRYLAYLRWEYIKTEPAKPSTSLACCFLPRGSMPGVPLVILDLSHI